jgi:hypothetical protein
MLNYAIKVGLTKNTLSLEDKDQQAAQEWLGASPKLYRHTVVLRDEKPITTTVTFELYNTSSNLINTLELLFQEIAGRTMPVVINDASNGSGAVICSALPAQMILYGVVSLASGELNYCEKSILVDNTQYVVTDNRVGL